MEISKFLDLSFLINGGWRFLFVKGIFIFTQVLPLLPFLLFVGSKGWLTSYNWVCSTLFSKVLSYSHTHTHTHKDFIKILYLLIVIFLMDNVLVLPLHAQSGWLAWDVVILEILFRPSPPNFSFWPNFPTCLGG